MSPSEVQEKSQGQTCTVYSLSDIDGPFRGVTTTGTETESWLCKAEPWPTMRTGGPFGSQPTRQREKNALPKLLSGGSSRKLPGHLQNTNPGSEHRKKTLYFLSDGALTCGLWFCFLKSGLCSSRGHPRAAQLCRHRHCLLQNIWAVAVVTPVEYMRSSLWMFMELKDDQNEGTRTESLSQMYKHFCPFPTTSQRCSAQQQHGWCINQRAFFAIFSSLRQPAPSLSLSTRTHVRALKMSPKTSQRAVLFATSGT